MPKYCNDGLSPRIVSGLSGLSITVRPGESVETYNILVGPGWTKISDEPYAPLTSIRKSVTAPGSVSGLRDSALISLVADAAGIVVTPNAAGNEHGFELPKGVVVEIENLGEIDTLYFAGTGKVLVQAGDGIVSSPGALRMRRGRGSSGAVPLPIDTTHRIRKSYPLVMGMNISRPATYDNEEYTKQLASVDFLVLNYFPRWKDHVYGPGSIHKHARKIKALNPNIFIAQYTILMEATLAESDASNKDRAEKIDREGWWLRNAAGERVQHTSSHNAWDVNISHFAPADSDGLRYSEWLARRNYALYFSEGVFDAWYLDNSLSQSPSPAANWKLDGVDITGPQVNEAYRDGQIRYWDEIRRLHPQAMLIGNSDDLAEYRGQLQGAFLEALIGQNWSIEKKKGWLPMMERYYSFMDNVRQPKLVGFNVHGDITDYKTMRYGLTSCLMNDGFFVFTDKQNGYSSITKFDEYNLNLGLPIELPPPLSLGLSCRRFEGGIAIVNPTNETKVVNVGPGYRRFGGLQDSAVNNGQTESNVSVPARDGLILVKV